MKPDYLNAIVHMNELENQTSFNIIPPSNDLKHIVELFWSIKWNLPDGKVFNQQIIPNPHINIVHYGDSTFVEGVVKKLFEYHLQSSGEILGIKFKIGAFNNLTKVKMSTFTNQKIQIGEILEPTQWENLKDLNSTEEKVVYMENLLLNYAHPVDNKGLFVEKVINYIRENKSITSVDMVAKNFNKNIRSIQRDFDTYVGVNPKWIIRMFRLQELNKELEMDSTPHWADLAAKLGYADQPHMINDFKSILGITPREYKE
ncbi:DUF6597 domain-containing transcriptional factor [Vallitalea okinawensis]|uniref:DUF6597 domain-containing transcriptional factor n=1 Tax=Vallitalea okinawensis TaxID=2078660 RepID=UPI000CFC2ACD|nr:DUF6597 domain-containing transcriptional factor [Vallitalea okinawensis]